MIKAIVFDCYGVLATDGWLPFKERYFGHDRALLQEATDLNKQADAGYFAYSDFMQAVANLAGIAVAEASKQIEANVPNTPLFDYILELKPAYKIGMLSNAASNQLDRIFTAEQLSLFDATALSYQTGFIKPQIGAYESVAAQLAVTPEDCVLIDDQERYCAGARDVGMRAILYRNIEQAKTDLEGLLDGRLSSPA